MRAPNILRAILCLIGCLTLTGWLEQAQATNPLLSTPENGDQTSELNLVPFAQIAKTAPNVELWLENVKVAIHHVPAEQDISVSSNCPAHWLVRGNTVKQVALSTTQKGVSLRADGQGGQITLNGRIYQLPRGSDGSIKNLMVENGMVIINGQKLEPLSGSDKPGSCTGPDSLEITIPAAYAGGLTLNCQGNSEVVVDNWQSGELIANLNGTSRMLTGKLNQLSKIVVDIQGSGLARIKELSANAFVANINGSGSVLVDAGHANMSNATISGTGTMTFHGKFANLKKSVSGTGTIQVMN